MLVGIRTRTTTELSWRCSCFLVNCLLRLCFNCFHVRDQPLKRLDLLPLLDLLLLPKDAPALTQLIIVRRLLAPVLFTTDAPATGFALGAFATCSVAGGAFESATGSATIEGYGTEESTGSKAGSN
ncbi:hypothetical protein SUGI_1225090 [Cryptomeria japonica]|uniref:Uncharacterized protein n=1 Tax=Cryptomeria japonica TaxID=3369 RepID=A0AAD3NPU9_CRYJA|nr:hypothetical protein SUGI_1225090 [Cryptomeria japonica]